MMLTVETRLANLPQNRIEKFAKLLQTAWSSSFQNKSILLLKITTDTLFLPTKQTSSFLKTSRSYNSTFVGLSQFHSSSTSSILVPPTTLATMSEETLGQRTVYFGNLAWSVSNTDLKEFAAECGEVEHAEVLSYRDGRKTGSGKMFFLIF